MSQRQSGPEALKAPTAIVPASRALTLRHRTEAVQVASTVRAAQYVRMSTEHQAYSPQNQITAIAEYAEEHGLAIVRTYIDEAKSGLKIRNRPSLRQLLSHVQSDIADFDVILVYDVSRWGRFQNADESAYYEFICHLHGKHVEYCAEPFENDGGALATLMKSIKRTMAGEYSRELSVKSFAGLCRTVSNGFRAGAQAGYGLRRMLIAPDGRPKGILELGEHKVLANYRVILVPGPKDEIATVRRIYRLFVERRWTPAAIADVLNRENVKTPSGRSWARGAVCGVLTNEKYIGNLVYNRASSKLGASRTLNDPAKWLRVERAFKPIVPARLFYAAQARTRRQANPRYTEEEMLALMRQTWARDGILSGRRMGKKFGTPSASCYWHRFGTMANAYRRIGYEPHVDTSYVLRRPHLRKLRAAITMTIMEAIHRGGDLAHYDTARGSIKLNSNFGLAVLIAPYLLSSRARRAPRWGISKVIPDSADVVVVVRMDPDNEHPRDYFLLPRALLRSLCGVLNEVNGSTIDVFRVATLDPLFRALVRVSVEKMLS